MKTAFSYIRWSTSLQGKEGKDSKKRQTESAEKWITEHGRGRYILSEETFIDAGKSAHTGKHIAKDEAGKAVGELARFIELVEQGTIVKGSVLLVDSYDRFARLKPTKSLTLFMSVIDAGIGLVFTGSYRKEVIDTDAIDADPNILQFIIGEMIRSYSESAEKGRKIKSALQAKKQRLLNGEIVEHNNVPKYLSFNATTIKYIHNQNTVQVLRMAKAFLEGNSLYSLAKTFNDEGVKTFRRGFKWSAKSCKCILQNRVLVGEFLGNKHFCTPIIEQDDYNKIQNMLAKNEAKVSGRESKTLVNLFRGIARCSECGAALHLTNKFISTRTGEPYPNGAYRYFKCPNSVGGKKCKNRNYIPANDLEAEFFIEFLMKTPEGLITSTDGEIKAITRQLTIKQNEKADNDKQIERLLHVNADLGLDQFHKQAAKLKVVSDTLQEAIDFLSLTLRQAQGSPVDYGNLKEVVMSDPGIDGEKAAAYDGQYDSIVKAVQSSLADNEVRKQIRTLLPSLIGRVKVYTQVGDGAAFEVLNRQGKVLYTSIALSMETV